MIFRQLRINNRVLFRYFFIAHVNTQMTAHAAHKCTQIIIFLTINILSLISFVCKVKKLCAKRAFCVQSGGMCAECVQICAGRVQIPAFVC